MLFRDAAAEWFEEYKQDRELRTVCIADELLRVHILPSWGEMDMRNITHDAIQAFAVSLSQHGPSAVYPQGLTRPSIKRDISILRRIFDREIHQGNVVSNPATGISLKGLPIRSREVMIFTPDEVTLLIRSARPRWFADLLILAYRTGMRRGELYGLRWEDVDLNLERLYVRRSISCPYAGMRIEKEPKTPSSRRTILLDGTTVSMLAQRKADWGQSSPWVIVNAHGQAPSPWDTTRLMNKACIAAGLQPRGIHTLRHTHASILLSKGVYIKTVQQRLGHASISTTLQTYAHALVEMQKEAVGIFDSLS